MSIKLGDIWHIEKPEDYKVHFARWNGKISHLKYLFVAARNGRVGKNTGQHAMSLIALIS